MKISLLMQLSFKVAIIIMSWSLQSERRKQDRKPTFQTSFQALARISMLSPTRVLVLGNANRVVTWEARGEF